MASYITIGDLFYRLNYSVTSQNSSGNKSTLTVKLTCDNNSSNANHIMSGLATFSVNGKSYSATVNTTIPKGGSAELARITGVEVEHDFLGECELNLSVSYPNGYVSLSLTAELPPTDRSSTLSISGGILGVEQSFAITRKSSRFESTVTWVCGTETGILVENSTETSVKFVLPVSLAAQNTTGTTVSVTFSIETLYNNRTIGRGKTYERTFNIPESVKPYGEISVSDVTGVFAKFNKYIEKASKWAIEVIPMIAYGSEIVSCEITANGAIYAGVTATTDKLIKGKQEIKAIVTDQRGRIGTISVEIEVFEYPVPQINSLKVLRCKSLEDGTEDITGGFAQVTFTASVEDLTIGNTPTYTLEYRKSSDSDYTRIEFDEYTGDYSVTANYRFEAEDTSPYIVRLTVEDGIARSVKTTVISIAEVLEHWHFSGRGISFGKIATDAGVFDVGYLLRPFGGFLPNTLDYETDFNNLKIPNIYVGEISDKTAYSNCPITSGSFGLEVVAVGINGEVKQVLTVNNKTASIVYVRVYDKDGWGDWFTV